MVDKPQTFARNKIGETFGRLDNNAMLRVNRAFAVFLGFA
jgi:mRNA interferase MazF